MLMLSYPMPAFQAAVIGHDDLEAGRRSTHCRYVGQPSDWLFMGVLFHAHYNRHPEIWWPEIRAGKDRTGIIWASALGYLSTAAIVGACAITHVHGVSVALLIAALAWLAGPFLVVVVNGMFIKIDSHITFAHCVGYLARFLLAGVAAGLALG